MKKLIYSVLTMVMVAFTLASCSDVPMPYNDPTSDNTNEEPAVEIEPTGEGTLESPFNVAAAIEYTEALGSDIESNENIYIKGIVTSIKEEYSTQYGNSTFYISDDAAGTNEFYAYRVLYLGNKKYTSGDQPQEGDEVIICGKVINYSGNTPETVVNQAYLYSLNGKVGDSGGSEESQTGVATGDGTKDNPYNSVAANKFTSSLAADATSENDIYIKGKIVSIKENFTTQYGNASFYISDDGSETNQFYVFRTLYLGNVKYTAGDLPKVGDEVVICGKVTNYKGNTPETVQNQSYIYSLTSNGGGTTDEGDTSTANGDFETWVDGQPNNWKTTSTAGNATLKQSSDAHGGKYSVEVTGSSSANKRLGYKETTLKAGDYTMTFYAKAASSTGASVRPGYVQVTDGTVGSYNYGSYTNDITSSEWVKVSHTFSISADGTYCVVIMNSKSPGGNVLIDDFILTKDADGTVIIK